MRILKYFVSLLVVVGALYSANRYYDYIKDFFLTDKESLVVKEDKISQIEYLSDKYVTYIFNKSATSLERKEYRTISSILEREELVVCAKKDDNNQLFQMKTEEGKYVGKDIDLAKHMAATLGVRLVYKMIYDTYDDVIEAVRNGEGDIGIAKLSYTPERCRKVLYSVPYVTSRKTLLINREQLKNTSKNNIKEFLNNKQSIVGVTKDTCYETFVNRIFPRATIILDKDWENKILQSLVDGKITATMRDEIRIKLILKKNPSMLIKVIPIILDQEMDSIAAVVGIENIEILFWLNKFIETEQMVDTVNSLIDKYGAYVS